MAYKTKEDPGCVIQHCSDPLPIHFSILFSKVNDFFGFSDKNQSFNGFSHIILSPQFTDNFCDVNFRTTCIKYNV